MAKVGYFDRELKPIPKDVWTAKSNDPSYWTVRQYDNAVVRVTLKWVGRVPNPGDSFPDYWPMFILLVQNYRSDGSLANDPADGDRTFPNEAAAIGGYEDFLLKWTQCAQDEEGAFVEADNTLTLPAPPDPNKPATESDELGGTGAW